jgi:hypothetical protein
MNTPRTKVLGTTKTPIGIQKQQSGLYKTMANK